MIGIKSNIRSIRTNVKTGLLNTSNKGPAFSTLCFMCLEKLATTLNEARQMLSFINTINKINIIQKRSNFSNVHFSDVNSNI